TLYNTTGTTAPVILPTGYHYSNLYENAGGNATFDSMRLGGLIDV
ncbi:unnamed protein product, partial [marine sediment metagenome]